MEAVGCEQRTGGEGGGVQACLSCGSSALRILLCTVNSLSGIVRVAVEIDTALCFDRKAKREVKACRTVCQHNISVCLQGSSSWLLICWDGCTPAFRLSLSPGVVQVCQGRGTPYDLQLGLEGSP